MSTAVATTKKMAALPAALRAYADQNAAETAKELSGGITSGFPIISIRGKVWRVRSGGVETDLLDDDNEPVPNIRVVMIKSNPLPSKIYYKKKYESGSNEAPDCWSSGGVKPDREVQHKVSPVCATCPMNVWGSKITEEGKKTRACGDVRRLAVVSEGDLQNWVEDNTAALPVHLLRVPAASLNPLKDYAEKVLKPRGFPYFGVVTKIGFDATAEYAKLKFTAVGTITDEMAEKIIELRDSEDVRRILAEAEEFAGAGSTDPSEASPETDESGEEAQAAPAPAARKAPAKKAQPAQEEDVDLDQAEEAEEPAPPPKRTGFGAPKAAAAPAAKPAAKPAPKPAPKAAAPVEDEDEDMFGGEEEDAPAAAPPKAAAKPAVAKPAPAPAKLAPKKKAAPPPAEEAEEETAAAAEDGGDFDSMLESILG